MLRLLAILILLGAAQDKSSCVDVAREFAVSDILMQAMGIGTGFATEFRVERKSTNVRKLADDFLKFIEFEITYLDGEKPPYERDPPNPGMTNITNTIYPFSRELQGLLSTRIRIRQYGERAIGDTSAFLPTMGDVVGFELKAQTNTPGVVVKPIIRIKADWQRLLFTNTQTLSNHQAELINNMGTLNPKIKTEVFGVALNVVQTFHHMNETVLGNTSVSATSVAYSRKGLIIEVIDKLTAQIFKIQITSDRAIEMRDQVDPKKSPHANSDTAVSHRYPSEGPDALVVTEMKSPVELNDLFLKSPSYVEKNIPTYFLLRQKYEQLQGEQAAGFEADSGKAKQLIKSPLDVPAKDKAIMLETGFR